MINRFLKQILPAAIKDSLRQKLGVPNQQSSILRLKSLGFTPRVILDIGAYEGNWFKFIHKIYPQAKVLMVEAQHAKQPLLKQICSLNPGSDFRIALLGGEKKEVQFNIYDTASSVLTEYNETGALIQTRELTLLDELIKNTNYAQPDLIKLDTQGYELEVLKGGINALSHAQAVLMEVSLIDIYKHCPLVSDVIRFMQEHNFVLYDICSLMRRPFDQALFQADFLFVKINSDLRKNKRWI